MKTETDAALSSVSSMRVGGPASRLLRPESAFELAEALRALTAAGARYMVLGNGSNTLFGDDGFAGTIVLTTAVAEVSVDGTALAAECGASLSALARRAAEAGLTGAEFLYGIPGTVGGAVYMNAGAYGGQISDILLSVECLTASGEIVTLCAEELDFGYRRSALQKNGAVLLRAVFGLRRGEREKIEETMRAHMQARREKQPLEYPSCGSVFKRPEGHFAGALIEQCGLKGLRVGGAEVSEKHAGFIVNRGNATASDVMALIRRVSDTVFERTGVRLEPEIRIVE